MGFSPIFKKGLILKQHMLEALRDYPYEFVMTFFAEMGEGVITGLSIQIDKAGHFIVNEGIVKIKGKVYFITEKATLQANDEMNYVYLEVAAQPEIDGTEYNISIIQKKEKDDSLFELFRYVKNASIREYTDIKEAFADTINRVDQRFSLKSVKGGSIVSGKYFSLFAEYILSKNTADIRDVAFAYQCLNELSCIDVIQAYFKTENVTNENILYLMKNKIEELDSTEVKSIVAEPEKKRERRVMID